MIPKNKTIAIVHPQSSKKGWAITMMIFLGNVLAKYNKVTLFTQSYDEKIFWDILQFSVVVDNKISLALKMRHCDYIIVWNSPMQFVWVLAKIYWWGKAKVYWWHHHYPWYYEQNARVSVTLKKYLEKLCLLMIDKIIANSQYLSDALINIYWRKSYILYPVVWEKFVHYIDQNKSYSGYTLFSYSRWEKGKNLEQIFMSYETLKLKFPNLEVLIWWVGEELDYYKETYKDNKNIHFLWYLNNSDIIKYSKNANLFLFPSTIDSFWMSAIEAMALYLPVIWFFWKWLNEIIQDGKNWYLVKSKIEFTEKIDIVLQNKALNSHLWEYAKQTIFRFSEISFEKQVWKIFDKETQNTII